MIARLLIVFLIKISLMETQVAELFFVIHRRGNDFHYIKTNAKYSVLIWEIIEDNRFWKIEQVTPQRWQDNIEQGKSFEVLTKEQFIDLTVKMGKYEND